MHTSSRVELPRAARLARAAAALALLSLALIGAACAGGNDLHARDSDRRSGRGRAGTPPESTGASSTASPEPSAPRLWEPARSLSAFRKATARAASQHMQGDLQGEVLTNAEASAYPSLGPTRSVAPGAVIVEAHYKPDSPDPVVLFVMEKSATGGWEYMIVEPSGAIVQRGRDTLCARCHAEAPNDHLFGVAH